MPLRYFILALGLWVFTSNVNAQKVTPKASVKKVSYPDSFTTQLAKDLDGLVRQLSLPVDDFDKKMLARGPVVLFRNAVVTTNLLIPNTSFAYLRKMEVNWEPDGTGTTSWVWQGEITRYHFKDKDKMLPLQQKYLAALKMIYGKYKTDDEPVYLLPAGNEVRLTYNGGNDSTSMLLSVSFKQAAAHRSALPGLIAENYKLPLYSARNVAEFEEAVTCMELSFKQAGFTEDEQVIALTPVCQHLANGSIRRVIGFLLSYGSSPVVMRLQQSLSPGQNETVKKLAVEFLENQKKPGYNYLDGPVNLPPVAKVTSAADAKALAAQARCDSVIAAMKARYNYEPGTMFIPPYEFGKERQKLIITGPYDCVKGGYSGTYHYWFPSTKNKGYYVAVPTFITPKFLNKAQKEQGSYFVCGACGGKGFIDIKELTKVDVTTRYRSDHGKVVPDKSESMWTNKGRISCDRCGGNGLIINYNE